MGSLMGLHVSCQQHKRRTLWSAPPERLQTVFRVSGVDSIVIYLQQPRGGRNRSERKDGPRLICGADSR